MSLAERFVRHHKRQTDRAISQAYARLESDPPARAAFLELLPYVRSRATRLLAAPMDGDSHPGIEALVNLSRFAHAHVRPVADWVGSDASWRGAVCALAQHLLGRYRVPAFLAAAWFATGASGDTKRQWFVAHAAGASFRSLALPMRMTRKMEHIFLQSPAHLGIEYAMRRAELLGLGATDRLVSEVMMTPAAGDVCRGDFWQTVWVFLIANARAIDPTQIRPIVDFLEAQPSFSMRGRTVQSVLRLMHDWHRRGGVAYGGLTWPASPIRPLVLEERDADPSIPALEWHVMELTNGEQLRQEGAALRHCVASYAERCWRGTSRIWSVRSRRGERVRHRLTVEVDMKARAVVQACGWGNRPASGRALRVLETWATSEGLRLTATQTA